jgi:DNA polymerase-3 subunit alpha
VRKDVILAGVVMDVRKRGPRVSIVLDDDTERIEVTLFEDVFAQCKHLITKHAVLIAEGQLRYDDFINGWRQTARRVRSADDAIQEYARRITIRWPVNGAAPTFVRDLQRTLTPFRGGKCEVCIEYASAAGAADLTLGDQWSVRLTRELRDHLTHLLGDDRYLIHYPRHIV